MLEGNELWQIPSGWWVVREKQKKVSQWKKDDATKIFYFTENVSNSIKGT